MVSIFQLSCSMKVQLLAALFFFAFFLPGKAQSTAKNKVVNKEFNWSIVVPDSFEHVSADEWARLQNRGAEALEKTTEQKVENRANTIFVFKKDHLNYLEANWQPFDVKVDGNYSESCQLVQDLLYETFTSQMPGSTMDTVSSTEVIDGLKFHRFKMDVQYPNKVLLHVLMYSRLFGKRDFSLNIMYVDEDKGRKMLQAWKQSKFVR